MRGRGVGGERRWVWMYVLMGAAAACDAAPPDAGPARPAELRVLGLNGRHLATGEHYWLPFDHEGEPLPLWQDHREALAIRNIGARPITVTRVRLLPGAGATPDALRLLAPTRAAERPLPAQPARLAPGEQLDLDVLARLVASGRHSATLRVDVADGPPLVITLLASGAGESRLWPGAPRIASRSWGAEAAIERVVAVASAPSSDTAYAVGWVSGLPGVPESAFLTAWSRDGAHRWSRVLHAPGLTRPAASPHGGLGVCADADGVVLVGTAEREGRRRVFVARVHTTGDAGPLRLWSPTGAHEASAADCAIDPERIWVTGSLEAGAADVRALLLAVRGDDLAPSGVWSHGSATAGVDRGNAVVATPSGPVVGTTSGGGGAVLLPAFFATRLDAPVVGLAAAPDAGSLALLDVDGDLDVARLGRDGSVVWRRQLRHPRPTWTVGPIVTRGHALWVGAAGAAGAWTAQLDVARGTVHASAVLRGPTQGSWHLAGLVPHRDGVTVFGDGTLGAGAAGAWYRGAVGASAGDTDAVALAPTISPAGLGWTHAIGTAWWWWDPADELATTDPAGVAGERHDGFVAPLPWRTQ